jgi:hypothetical protein
MLRHRMFSDARRRQRDRAELVSSLPAPRADEDSYDIIDDAVAALAERRGLWIGDDTMLIHPPATNKPGCVSPRTHRSPTGGGPGQHHEESPYRKGRFDARDQPSGGVRRAKATRHGRRPATRSAVTDRATEGCCRPTAAGGSRDRFDSGSPPTVHHRWIVRPVDWSLHPLCSPVSQGWCQARRIRHAGRSQIRRPTDTSQGARRPWTPAEGPDLRSAPQGPPLRSGRCATA